MNSKEIVKDVLRDRGWSQSKLAEEAGFKTQSNITGILNRGTSMKVDSFMQMLHAMGCELVVRDKMGSGKEWIVKE